jgi:uncharacterized protein (DUF2384 family)
MKRAHRKPIAKRGRRAVSFKKVMTGRKGRSAVSHPFSTQFLEPDGRVAIDQMMQALRMTKSNLAETIGVATETLQRTARTDAPKTQARLRETAEIISRVSPWAGGPMQAMAWYRAEPIPAFGGRTAESLVKEGKASAVRDYLDGVALGGFA